MSLICRFWVFGFLLLNYSWSYSTESIDVAFDYAVRKCTEGRNVEKPWYLFGLGQKDPLSQVNSFDFYLKFFSELYRIEGGEQPIPIDEAFRNDFINRYAARLSQLKNDNYWKLRDSHREFNFQFYVEMVEAFAIDRGPLLVVSYMPWKSKILPNQLRKDIVDWRYSPQNYEKTFYDFRSFVLEILQHYELEMTPALIDEILHAMGIRSHDYGLDYDSRSAFNQLREVLKLSFMNENELFPLVLCKGEHCARDQAYLNQAYGKDGDNVYRMAKMLSFPVGWRKCNGACRAITRSNTVLGLGRPGPIGGILATISSSEHIFSSSNGDLVQLLRDAIDAKSTRSSCLSAIFRSNLQTLARFPRKPRRM